MGDLPEGPRFEIRVGQNNGYRYIGIAPPLTDEILDRVTEDGPFDIHVRHPDDESIPYTELGCDTAIVGEVDTWQRARSIANALARLYSQSDRPDYSVAFVSPNIQTLGGGVFLFSDVQTESV